MNDTANKIGAINSNFINPHGLHEDNHYAPFTLKIDYEPIIRALKEIDYQGDMTLEACYYLKKEYTPENYLEGLRIMADGAKRLAQMYEDLVL